MIFMTCPRNFTWILIGLFFAVWIPGFSEGWKWIGLYRRCRLVPAVGNGLSLIYEFLLVVPRAARKLRTWVVEKGKGERIFAGMSVRWRMWWRVLIAMVGTAGWVKVSDSAPFQRNLRSPETSAPRGADATRKAPRQRRKAAGEPPWSGCAIEAILLQMDSAGLSPPPSITVANDVFLKDPW